MSVLLPAARPDRPAVTAAGMTLSHAELTRLCGPPAERLRGIARVALWAPRAPETAIGVAAALRAGAAVIPVNPKAGGNEVRHILDAGEPEAVLCGRGAELPDALTGLPRVEVGLEAPSDPPRDLPEPEPERPALILFTSGTTGPPKGVVISRRAIAADIDGLAEAWGWTERDAVAHALPLFHAHGLILGLIGPLRLGGTAVLIERFSPESVATALEGGATMLFGVPTMYRRLRLACEEKPEIARALSRARLLVSGSAALPAGERREIERLTGRRIVERYGMTETLITIAQRADGDRAPGYVGVPVPGVEVRLVDERGLPVAPVTPGDDGAIGELEVRGPTLFEGYLGDPDATRDAYRDGWFRTGDIATRDASHGYRILGRRDRDIIKTGGYRVGAAEVEAALLDHPSVEEAAVVGVDDEDLGQRIVAWVVARARAESLADELIDHVAAQLSAHKRPREIRFVDSLPRNPLGKVEKHRLTA